MAKTDFRAPADLRIVGSRLTIAGEAQFNLQSMGTQKLPDGAIVYVQSVKAYFRLDKMSTETADGISVVTAAFGTGRWFRLPSDFAGRSPWLAQTQWWVDAVNGSDENTGGAVGQPIATFAELRRRFGDNPLIDDQTYDIFLLSDVDEVFDMSARFAGDEGAIWLHGGEKTQLATDTISAWTSLNTPDEPAITGTAISDFSPYKGARARLTAGALNGSTFFFGDVANSGAVGSEIWRHGVLGKYLSGAGVTPVAPQDFSSDFSNPGNVAFTIATLYQIRGVNLHSARLDTGSGGGGGGIITPGFIVSDVFINPQTAQPLCTVEHSPVLGNTNVGWGQPLFFRCIFGNSGPISASTVRIVGCCFSDNGGGAGKGTALLSSIHQANISGFDVKSLVCCDTSLFEFDNVFCDADSGAAFVQMTYGSRTATRDLAVVGMWNPSATIAAFYVDETSVFHADEIWGAVDGGAVGFDVDGRMFYVAIADINGLVVTGNDSEVGGTVKAYGALPYVEPTNNAMIVVNP